MAILKNRHDEIEKLCAKYPSRRSALLPVLWMVQEQEGWVSQDAMKEVAEIIGCTAAEVYEVVSFYTMYNQKPVGRHHIQFCHTLACAICGSHEAVGHIREKYGFDEGASISRDGKFSLVEVECIGACTEAPAMLVGETLYGNLTPERLDEVLNARN
ncbi:NADH-quinone oxidoreductase subunit NuoE [Candidatus Sumerlaeota bacterium]|nr:NADH-quinone oxidoreductase subunit NuoE [Candidatus Sumerlaeota bacterium]